MTSLFDRNKTIIKHIVTGLLLVFVLSGCMFQPGEYARIVMIEGEEIFPNYDRIEIYITKDKREIHFQFYDPALRGPGVETFSFKRKLFGKYVIEIEEDGASHEYDLRSFNGILIGTYTYRDESGLDEKRVRFRRMNTPEYLK